MPPPARRENGVDKKKKILSTSHGNVVHHAALHNHRSQRWSYAAVFLSVIGFFVWIDLRAGTRLPQICVLSFRSIGCPPVPEIHGFVAPGYENVFKTFQSLHVDGHEVGSSFAAFVNGTKVVDLWAGVRFADEYAVAQFKAGFHESKDVSVGEPWKSDTIAVLFSQTKGIAALACGMLVDRGHLDLEATVASIWPEFAANGKENVTVRDVLKHESGVLMPSSPIDPRHLSDQTHRELSLANALPRFTNALSENRSTASPRAYQAVIYGDLLNAIFRRSDPKGRLIGRFLREEVTGPLGISSEFFLGDAATPFAAQLAPPHPFPAYDRIVRSYLPALLNLEFSGRPERERTAVRAFIAGDPYLHDALINVFNMTALDASLLSFDLFSRRSFLIVDQPASNGMATARAIAKIYAALSMEGNLDGVQLLSPKTLRSLLSVHESEPKFDRGLYFNSTFSDGGWGAMPPRPGLIEAGKNIWGWPGYGGSLAGFNPSYHTDAGTDVPIALSYVMNGLGYSVDWRMVALYDAFAADVEHLYATKK